MLRYIIVAILVLLSQSTHAQVEMADNFRGEGKIYVVIAVILIIMAGFFYLLFKLDKRAKQLEKEIEEK
ncbi:MAG: CcmD family protein [Ekhidna sp.]|nr:CcmD family protein [Ekhidna sp.]